MTLNIPKKNIPKRPEHLPETCVIVHDGKIDRELWLAGRIHGIGASDVPAITGTSPWKSKLDLWAYKTGEYNPPDEMTEAMKAGVMLEPSVIAWWEDETGWEAICCGWKLAHKDWDAMTATVDAIGRDPDDPTQMRVVEAKTTRNPRSWQEVPPYYRDQVLWQQHVTGLKDHPGQIPVLHGGINFEVWDVEWDEDRFATILSKVEEFWQHVQTKERPKVSDPQDYDAMKHLVRIKKGTKIVSSKVENLVAEYRKVKAEREEIEKKEKLLKAKIVEQMDGHDSLVTPTGKLLAKQTVYTRRGYGKGLLPTLKNEYPELYDRFATETEVTRYEIDTKE